MFGEKKGERMKLIIGGYAQNKLSYVKSRLAEEGRASVILDESSADAFLSDPSGSRTAKGSAVVVDHLHLIIRATGNRDAAEALIHTLERICADSHSELILICDELGCGVVPVLREDRNWREDTGRILCDLAARAESVERIICGIPVRIR